MRDNVDTDKKPLEKRVDAEKETFTRRKRASLRSLKNANQLRKYERLVSQLQLGKISIHPMIVADALSVSAELEAHDQFRELVDSYVNYVMNKDPIRYPKRRAALKFIDYICLAADYGVSTLIRLRESQKINLEIRASQETLHKLFDAPYAYK